MSPLKKHTASENKGASFTAKVQAVIVMPQEAAGVDTPGLRDKAKRQVSLGVGAW